MYETVAKAVREVDQNTIIFWEAATWSHWTIDTKYSTVKQFLLNFFRCYKTQSIHIQTNHFRRNPFLSWIVAFSRGLGIELSIDETDFDLAMDLMNQSRNGQSHLWPSTEESLQLKDEIGYPEYGSGLQTVPGGDQFQNRSVLSW